MHNMTNKSSKASPEETGQQDGQKTEGAATNITATRSSYWIDNI